MAKKAPKAAKRKRESKPDEEENAVVLPAKRMSNDAVPAKGKWTNKQRVLVFATRGITHRDRHLMQDLKTLMPHHKTEAKMEKTKSLRVVNEMCEMKNCNKAVLIEARRSKDTYMWFANSPNGPSVKCLVENIHTMAELKMTGNCLRGSRPLLSFDPQFVEKPHYNLLKELLVQIFCVPNHHPKSQPFFDHVFTFTILDNRIWFRNFQILNDEGSLAEVGPRFLLNPVKIFSGSFTGTVLWENAHYISPAKHRRQINLAVRSKYVGRKEQKLHAEATKPKESYKLTPLEDIFKGEPYERAKELQNGNVDEKESIKVLKKGRKKRSLVISESEEGLLNSPTKKNKIKKVDAKPTKKTRANDVDSDAEMKINIVNTKKALKRIEDVVDAEESAIPTKKKKKVTLVVAKKRVSIKSMGLRSKKKIIGK